MDEHMHMANGDHHHGCSASTATSTTTNTNCSSTSRTNTNNTDANTATNNTNRSAPPATPRDSTWNFVQMNMTLLPIARPLPVSVPLRFHEGVHERKPHTPTQKLRHRALCHGTNMSPRRHDVTLPSPSPSPSPSPLPLRPPPPPSAPPSRPPHLHHHYHQPQQPPQPALHARRRSSVTGASMAVGVPLGIARGGMLRPGSAPSATAQSHGAARNTAATASLNSPRICGKRKGDHEDEPMTLSSTWLDDPERHLAISALRSRSQSDDLTMRPTSPRVAASLSRRGSVSSAPLLRRGDLFRGKRILQLLDEERWLQPDEGVVVPSRSPTKRLRLL